MAEFVPAAPGSRTFSAGRIVRLGDVSPSGRLRLDALARYLQDVAYDDARDAAVGWGDTWVLRRMELGVSRTPKWTDRVTLTTFCGGVGSHWAERRTTVRVGGPDGPLAVDASAVWVYFDPDAGRPTRLPEQFGEVWGDGGGRKADARLRHRKPPPETTWTPWPVRATDFDVLGHVNNAAYWAAVEEELARSFPDRRVAGAEIEYRTAVVPGEQVQIGVVPGEGGAELWVATTDGTVRASMTVAWRGGSPAR